MAKSSSLRQGFTLVEVIVAITVVNVMVALICQMFIAQNRLVRSLEDWCADDPVYFLQPDADPLARAVAVPAEMPRVAQDVLISANGDWPFEVAVVGLDRDLSNLVSRAYVRVSPSSGAVGAGGNPGQGLGQGKGKGKGGD